MHPNCGSLKFFHWYYSVFLVSQLTWHTYCGSLCCMFRCCVKMPSVVCMKIPVCWDVIQLRLAYRYQHFRWVCCFHHQGDPRTNCLTLKTGNKHIKSVGTCIQTCLCLWSYKLHSFRHMKFFFFHHFRMFIFCNECLFFVFMMIDNITIYMAVCVVYMV